MAEHHILEQTRHRPWPLPDAPWVNFQSWRDVLFLHWPVPYERLWPLVPRNLNLETHGGHAWLTVTPLDIHDVHMRGMPGVPGATNFPEINVRTYVRYRDVPGVYFFSLDAGSALAVSAARSLLNLPYHHAEMAVARDGDDILFASRRDEPDADPAEIVVRYGPTGNPRYADDPATLEHFLIERYCLYTTNDQEAVTRIQIHHGPWLLHDARVTVEKNTMADYLGLIEISDNAPIAHYSARQDTLIWMPEPGDADVA